MRLLYLAIALTIVSIKAKSQIDSISSLPFKSSKVAEKYLNSVLERTEKLDNRLSKQTNKALAKLAKEERRLYNALYKIDSVAANAIFADAIQSYESIQQKVTTVPGELYQKFNDYIPNLDTLSTTLKFLSVNEGILGKSSALNLKVIESNSKLHQLKGRLAQASEIMSFMRNRRMTLKAMMDKYPDLPKRMLKSLKSINKETYYYAEHLLNYKQILNEPEGIEKVVVSLLRRIPAFSNFFQRNSQLSGLFNAGSGSGYPSANNGPPVYGLQPRQMVQQVLQTQTGLTGSNTMRMIQQQLGTASTNVNGLEEKLRELKNISTKDLPAFKPNSQKTKTFAQRLFYGTDLQFGKATNFLPAHSDMALSLGYKMDDKKKFILSATYKLGLGTGWNNISITHQGVGFRGHLVWQLKGQFAIRGGSEWTYLPDLVTREQLKLSASWRQSAVLGINKQYHINKKLKGNIQVLYDFMYRRQAPYTSPILFRTGYDF